MTSVQLSTKTTLSATLLLVVILGSVLCPPCKARQLMQTPGDAPEERIETVCDNIETALRPAIAIFGSDAVFRAEILPQIRDSGNPRIKIALAIARFCDNIDLG